MLRGAKEIESGRSGRRRCSRRTRRFRERCKRIRLGRLEYTFVLLNGLESAEGIFLVLRTRRVRER